MPECRHARQGACKDRCVQTNLACDALQQARTSGDTGCNPPSLSLLAPLQRNSVLRTALQRLSKLKPMHVRSQTAVPVQCEANKKRNSIASGHARQVLAIPLLHSTAQHVIAFHIPAPKLHAHGSFHAPQYCTGSQQCRRRPCSTCPCFHCGCASCGDRSRSRRLVCRRAHHDVLQHLRSAKTHATWISRYRWGSQGFGPGR